MATDQYTNPSADLGEQIEALRWKIFQAQGVIITVCKALDAKDDETEGEENQPAWWALQAAHDLLGTATTELDTLRAAQRGQSADPLSDRELADHG